MPHPGLLPEVISVNAAALAEEYSNGFKNPSFGFPAVSSRSSRRAMMLANVGAAMLVPNADS